MWRGHKRGQEVRLLTAAKTAIKHTQWRTEIQELQHWEHKCEKKDLYGHFQRKTKVHYTAKLEKWGNQRELKE